MLDVRPVTRQRRSNTLLLRSRLARSPVCVYYRTEDLLRKCVREIGIQKRMDITPISQMKSKAFWVNFDRTLILLLNPAWNIAKKRCSPLMKEVALRFINRNGG